MMKKEPNRWLILIACVLINLCLGAGYAWSVFQKPLIDIFGWSTAEASLAFTLSFGMVPLAMIACGKIQDTRGPKLVTLAGGIIFGLGMFLTGFTQSLTTLYLTYGVMGGIGIGMAYGCTVATPVKWFPDQRGLAGGLTAAGFGSGAIVFAPLASFLIEKSGVLTTFRTLGIFYLVVIVLCSLLVTAPQRAPETAAAVTAAGPAAEGHTTGEMLRTGKFYILWLMYIIGCVSGLMIIGHASPIAQEQIGLSPAVAAISVSIIGLANTLGRIVWGAVSDRIGRYEALVMMFIVAGICMFLLQTASGFGMFIIAVCGVALSFGGFMGIFPSITADNFGTKSMGTNYGVMFTAFGLAAIIGPQIAAAVKQASGGAYGQAFLIAAGMSIIGVLLTLYTYMKLKKTKNLVTKQA
ncbi:MAG: OFA family MFS transporter [Heliobacteriaceae bacterium]|nr:OFA family MFS transporter [Heliobacteriaceae bacterium]MDD4587363.1 OFA family MFS transporter [Heliobacteriaceae bacterium]